MTSATNEMDINAASRRTAMSMPGRLEHTMMTPATTDTAAIATTAVWAVVGSGGGSWGTGMVKQVTLGLEKKVTGAVIHQ